jgi:uncharacterized peroxidase-related enzyme
MAHIRQIEFDEATGELAEFYIEMMKDVGSVPNIVKLSSLNVAAMSSAQGLYRAALYQDSVGLSRLEKEIVATAVSLLNGCGYCVESHAATIDDLAPDDSPRSLVLGGPEIWQALPLRLQTLLRFAERLTNTPNDMTSSDVEELRDQGLVDEDILDLVQLIGYFNYVSRLATALGVDPEPNTSR